MPFFPVDDDFAFHAKARAAGNAAVGLWTRAGAYCMKQANGGMLQRHELDGMGKPVEAKRLVEVRLWHAHGHDCDRCPQPVKGGWVFHDWTHVGRLKTAEQVREEREKARERMRANRAQNKAERSEPVRANEAGTSGARSTTPSPSPSVVVTSPVVLRSVPRNDLDDDDLSRIAEATGGDLEHARRVAADVLGRSSEPVRKAAAYVLRAIGDEPQRYRPARRNTLADQCPKHPGSLASNCGGCRSDELVGDA